MKNLFLKCICFFVCFVVLKLNSYAQVLDAPPLNGVYERKNTPTRKPIPYCNLREADVMWTKRVWRIVDMRQKINHPLYYPTTPIGNYQNLMLNLMDGILKEGSITLYNINVSAMSDDNEFNIRLSTEEAKEKFGTKYDTTVQEDIETGQMVQKVLEEKFDPGTVKKFLIKEDWFFDRQRSVMDVRIIGICPYSARNLGDIEADEPIAWIYFPQARNILASKDVFNRANTAERRTFDDIFMKRMFDSYIFATENVYNDRTIAAYIGEDGIDQLLESDKIKNDIFLIEHDLWEF
ncbi:MAG: hypothetical protein A2X12_01335 [Bacteroidetes bacterium GWE2_29_8]|nr:MAG: hypothetical protein A2X12_01335 [Bacteroidetes bacterium GWE2_29_8]OFY21744.1 MAG: hypothetical protein A2X02_00250 [Bacteroidetes bacterium GWF2_29_10]